MITGASFSKTFLPSQNTISKLSVNAKENLASLSTIKKMFKQVNCYLGYVAITSSEIIKSH